MLEFGALRSWAPKVSGPTSYAFTKYFRDILYHGLDKISLSAFSVTK